MRSAIRKCKGCERYTLKEQCSVCGNMTVMAMPPRYSPEDKYGDYRRRLKKMHARS